MRFKNIFLVFALAMLMLAGVAWADDDDDDGVECTPLIEAVHMNFIDYEISILGQCFNSEDVPEVTLCEEDVEVIDYTATAIVANFYDVPDGSCILSVCPEDDEDGDCDRFWIGLAPYGSEGELPLWGFGGAMQWVWDDGWIDIAGRQTKCWKGCNPKTKPRNIRHGGRSYSWVCRCPGGCCHWAPPILPILTNGQ